MSDWKSKLEGLRGTLPPGTENESENEAPDEPQVPPADTNGTRGHQTRQNYYPQRTKEMEEKEADEANPDFQTLVQLLNLKKDANRYWRVRDLFFRARRFDVEYDVNRWIGHEENPEAKRIAEKLKKQGYESAAYEWHLAAQPLGMRYGKGSKELRLKKANEFAKKADKGLEEIIASR